MKNKIVLRRDKKGLGCANAKRLIRRAVSGALKAENIDVPCEVSVLLTDDEGIRVINRKFRQVDSATDVLSFPAAEVKAGRFNPMAADTNPKTGRVVLGDMAISLEHVRAQATEFGHGTKHEMQYLTVHSVLHLLGYDHMDDGEMKREMRSREKEIMAQIEGVREE